MEFDETALQEVRERRLLLDQCDGWLFELIQPFIQRRVLEIGCGMGNLTRLLVDRELVVATDISEESVECIRREYKDRPNIQAAVCDAAKVDVLQLAHHKFDTVVSLNVLEHIENDEQVLQHAFELLIPGGQLILIVPAHQQLYGTMDSPIGHYRRYSIEEMRRKLTKAGFEVQVQRYLNPLGALGWFVNGRILKRKVPPVAQLKVFNRLMPLVAAVENRVETPFGLSVLSVARRPI